MNIENDIKFDVVLSNPPYNKNVDIKILKEIVPLAKELVVVHPSTWLIDRKMKTKLYNDFRDQINGKLKSSEMFNGNKIFNIDIFLPITITHIDNDYNGSCDVNYFNNKFTVNDIYDITKFGNEWFTIVKPFINKIKTYITSNGSVWDMFKDNNTNDFIEDNNKFCFQIPMGRGHSHRDSNNSNKMLKDDFYTFFSNDNNEVITKNWSGSKYFGRGKYTFFKTKQERYNFTEYLKTDFVRFCLSIYKNKKDNDSGEMELIPMLDFTQEWNDEKLHKYFNIDKETQEYITNFLPDYHNIRSNNG